MNSELLEFTRQALASGIERSDISKVLQAAGWDESNITAALNAFAEVKFIIPVPRPQPYLSAREVFLYLIMFAALYTATFNLGSMIFAFINLAFPDITAEPHWNSFNAAIRWDISSLIVAFPLFLYTFHFTNKAIETNPSRRDSKPRKWLTYLTLFLASIILMGDMICLVYNVLGGELTIRFILKVATIAFIGGGLFIYFLTDMRRSEPA
jgi:hypothetical protein